MKLIWFAMALGLFAVLLLPRFLFLETAPPGFFVDEAGAAAHVLCLQREGRNCNDSAWPVFSRTWGEGRVGPTFQYLGWAWTALFGGKMYSFRALSATVGLLTLVPLMLLVSRYAAHMTCVCIALSCLLSPWFFHSSRIAWDPPLAPFFLMAAVCSLLPGPERAVTVVRAAAAALCCIIAGLTYPPVLAQLVFLFPLLLLHLWRRKQIRLLQLAVFCLVIIFCAVLLHFADTSTVASRVGTVSIFSSDSRNPTANRLYIEKVPQLLGNLLQHLDPAYLAWSGEANMRHTVPGFGILSWVDTLSLLAALSALLGRFALGRPGSLGFFAARTELIALALLGFLAAIMAAALTWDSLPHGLRSLSGWPFLCILCGICLEYCLQQLMLRRLVVLVSLLYWAVFLRAYFFHFPQQAVWWFDTDVTDALRQHAANPEGWQEFLRARQYPAQAGRYFEQAYFSKGQ